ncbi:MAG: hypothetical protein ACXABD_13240 [Candidatus Thorarchaeota archaeon]|jgi:hypothetical protein
MGYSVEVSSIEELFKAIDRLPDTIESVNVQTSLAYFCPSQEVVTPDVEDWKGTIKGLVKSTLDCEKGNKVDEIRLRSYYGSGKDTDPYYIVYSSEGFRKFANDMQAGRHGKLD